MLNPKKNNLTEVMLNSLIPAQILSAALVNVNSFLNSIITGSLLGAEAIAAISFIQPVLMIIAMLGGGIATGAQVLCGRYVGRGDGDGANKIFSVSVLLSLFIGVIMTVMCLVFAEPISVLMGAEGEDLVRCIDCLRGTSWGIVFMLFSTALMSFMQLDNASNISLIATSALLAANVVFDFLNVAVFDWGMYGVGLATTFSYTAMMLVGFIYYLSKKCNFKLKPSISCLKESGELFYIGLPGAFSPLALALRALVLNNICFRLAGTIGVSAVGIFYTMSGFVSALAGGVGGAAGILSSVFVGERNRSSLQELSPMAHRKAYIMHIIAYVVVWFTAKPFAILFGTGASDLPFVIHAIRCSMTCLLVNPFACISFNMYKSIGNTWLVSICSVLDYFVFQCLASQLLSGVIGINAVWFGSIVSELGVYVIMVLYFRKKAGKFPQPFDYIYIPESVSVRAEDCFDVNMRTLEEVEEVSRRVIGLSKSKGIDSRRSYYCGLCIEEQCSNIILHGFTKGENTSKYSIDLRMIFDDGKIIISLRDNCKKFDPTNWHRKENEPDPMKGMGIRMVQKLATRVSYRHTFGLNALSIEL